MKFDKVGCQELDPKVLLYNRIFKTGSSTTESIITNSSSAMNYGYKIGEINAKSMQKGITKKSLITTQLIYRQIISVKTNLTYRTYGLLTTNQSSYLKQEIKSKRNLIGTDSFIYSLFHLSMHSFISSFLPFFLHLHLFVCLFIRPSPPPPPPPSLSFPFLSYMQTCFHIFLNKSL